MILIFEYNKFSLIKKISNELSDILSHIKIKGDLLYGSTEIDRSGSPITRIDSKRPIVAILLKFNIDSIEIKSIVNNTDKKGIATKILNIVFSNLDPDYTIIVNQDVSGGYWSRIVKQYPQFKWHFI